jgi:hypothetical protein
VSTAPIRLKTHWFRRDAPKTPQQQAGAMGFTLFRLAQQTLKHMRGASFDIDAGERYFAFLREWLVFLVAVADRLAHDRFDADTRAAFTTALVLHLADTLQDNEHDLLGAPAPGQPASRERFIDLYNELAGHYGEFGGEPGADEFAPDFAFQRYLGHRLEPTLPDKDRHWVVGQVMSAEAPEAVALVQRTMRELHSMAPRRMRHSSIGAD